ncbi:hypothetical protein ACFQHV_15035 [Promicromonospora thailandica]|uniref:Uncharacterized protein n=1 Tax=Promicromonospora thailandica TaxID=765201 RepID=A0A9X2FZZ1_9MICO|nr:hypothetical protein [Promicromonospora thailandica]MCP2264490.1 hypothetical protein [Promicromonospora thailandica]BFF20449.1 hypothetical protein GCM10025730_39700 [Promicromonospora thailandica]
MTTFTPAVRTAVPQSARLARAIETPSRTRTQPAPARPDDRDARRREYERAERLRAHEERVRDNLAARHPLALR